MIEPDMAKAYTQALAMGAVDLPTVIRWADMCIAAEPNPSADMIDLALSKTVDQAVSALNLMTTGADDEASARLLFGMFGDALEAEKVSYSDVAKDLFFWRMYETELESFPELMSFWDDIDLADEGSYGDPVEVRSALVEFLRENEARPAEARSP